MRSYGTVETNNGFTLIEKRIEDYCAMVLNLSSLAFLVGENRQKRQKWLRTWRPPKLRNALIMHGVCKPLGRFIVLNTEVSEIPF
ncbi:hypothetical protein CEXT_417941 [Caerostris extrusa]|uniref:Uncharacterized protein n=1 Tax=Caerostris extrusa TaxID=172846 RepID=A0AAV4SEE2_CAEEX|nr:hypothetical protein CEXT_417941 [Caerostris extrusa]